jgi:acetyl-CoA/propionyl-CoA carboxylase biotin carboxyl carrier protein
MFDTVLIANRGEIAVRIIRTLRAVGVRSVAVFSDADADARHVREADTAVRLGPAAARDSYLSIERLLSAAAQTGAQAIHPGYGFLAENAEFARACAAAGVVFIGPTPHAIDVMGDKIRAKLAVSAAGVPVVPGRTAPDMSDDDLVAAAHELGFPVLIKPSAGGGGKGMHVVEDPSQLRRDIAGARREAASSFGDDTLFLERLVLRPRHIEVQILADTHGTTLYLGERECSLQRRHQKVIEEAPSVLLDEPTRARIGAAAVSTAQTVGYEGAGTVEFIVSADAPGDFFFMEMNTRLQVEHPVTEMVTGIDLVEQQLRVAAGEPLGLTQADIRLTGHAIEARVYAEDPARGFLPTGGKTLVLREPAGPGIRVDSSLVEGARVGTTYDPMLAKVVAWAADRPTALARLDRALSETVTLGVSSNTAFLRALLQDRDVVAGELTTDLIEAHLPALTTDVVSDAAYVAWALHRHATIPGQDPRDPWSIPSGWRVSGPAETVWRVADAQGEPLELGVTVSHDSSSVRVGAHVTSTASLQNGQLVVDGRTHQILVAVDNETTWLWLDGITYPIRELPPIRRGERVGKADGEIRSPMPGAVVAVHAAVGDLVAHGDPLVVVEAMKMEHTLTAPFDGTLDEVLVAAGDQVVLGQPLARLTAKEAAPDA